jgi:Sec-independent protein translocase protein TatA
MNVFGIGVTELLFVLVVALIVLGPERMTQTARTLGKYMREVQRATAEIPRLLTLDEEPKSSPPPKRQQLPALDQPASEPEATQESPEAESPQDVPPQDEPATDGPSDPTQRT